MSWAASGQTHSGPWTLAECIRHAQENNITLQQTELQVKQREIQLETAKGSRLPMVSGSASENLSFGRGLTADNTYSNTNTTSTGFSLGTSVPVFQGLRISNGIKENELGLKAATADLQKAREDMSVSVAQAYTQILYNMELLDVALNQVGIDSLQLARLCLRTERPLLPRLPSRRRPSGKAACRPPRPATISISPFWTCPSFWNFLILRDFP